LLAIRHPALDPNTAHKLVTRLDRALACLELDDWTGTTQALQEVGRWAAQTSLAFELLTDATHLYKRVAIPWLMRAYPGAEGFLEGLVALDELLAAATAHLARGYFTG